MRPDISFLGQSVRSLQTMLRVIGAIDDSLPKVIPDGIYGPQTMTAVSAFQRKAGLPVTGVVNNQTWDAIRDAYQPARIQVEMPEKVTILMNAGQLIEENDHWSYLPLMQAMLLVLSQLYPQIPKPSNSGVMDAPTCQSLMAMQKYCGLNCTGELGKICWKHLSLQFTVNAARMERMLNAPK